LSSGGILKKDSAKIAAKARDAPSIVIVWQRKQRTGFPGTYAAVKSKTPFFTFSLTQFDRF
jgi:hypothetical protein